MSDLVQLEPDPGAIDPFEESRRVRAWQRIDESTFINHIAASHQPAHLCGQVSHWPAVAAARTSTEDLLRYLLRFEIGARAELFVGTAKMEGRFFYDDDMGALNFRKAQAPVRKLLEKLSAPGEPPSAPPVYMGSTPVRLIFPGFDKDNHLSLVSGKPTEPRMWIGNKSRIAPHFDESENVACVIAGRRRFVLFPPEQVENLYIGPLDFTMAGQPASMVDLRQPDFDRYPRFRRALDHAYVADLEAGDAIYIPALWWHGVEALSDFNILVNYWWRDSAVDAGSPFACLMHAIMTMNELPEPTREAWRALFDHFVFRHSRDMAEHLPIGRRGVLEPQSPQLRNRIRQFLLRVLSSR